MFVVRKWGFELFRLWSWGFWSLVFFFIRRIGSIGFFILGIGVFFGSCGGVIRF